MRLVTVATEPKGYFPYLLQSCKKQGIDLDVLGWGQKWQGFTWRLYLIVEYLQGLSDEEVVCFIDAYDVVMLRPAAELESFFKEFADAAGCKMIVGCDKPINMLYKMFVSWHFGKCQDKNLNAGTYIGFAGYIKRVLTAILQSSPNSHEDDQVQMIRYCKSDPSSIYIDCDSVFFITTLKPLSSIMGDGVSLINGKLSYYSHFPFFAHGNGNTNMKDLLHGLGYTMDKDEEQEIDQHNRSSVRRRCVNNWYYILTFTMSIILVLVAIYFVMHNVHKRFM